MATQYNQLIESNESLGQNPNHKKLNANNMNLMNNLNINMAGENNLIDEELNQNNNNKNMISSGFNPYQRPPQIIKWRNIMKIDIDLIRNTKDLSLLNSNLENLIYSDITEDDIQSVPEQNVAKLIKILQFLNEFLFEQRQIISNKLIMLQEEGKNLNKNKEDLDMNLLKQKEYIEKAKLEAKQRLKEIIKYKNEINVLVKNGKLKKEGLGVRQMKFTDINMEINSQNNANNMNNQNYYLRRPKEGYKCHYCTGKLFPSEFELKKHYNDVHLITQTNEEQKINEPNIKSPIAMPIEVNIPLNNLMNKNNNKNEILEKKYNDLRFEMQNYMHQNEMNNLKNQMMLQNNNNLNGNNYKQNMERMENAFNNTLKQFMEDVVKKVNDKPKIINNNNINLNNKEDIKKLDEEIENLKRQINQEEQSSKEYDIEIFKIRNQIKTITKKNKEIDNTLNIIPKKTNLAQEPNLDFQILRANKTRKKFRDHAGPIESDHDSEDERNKKNKKILDNLAAQTNLLNLIIKKTDIIHEKEIINYPPRNDIPKNENLKKPTKPKPKPKPIPKKEYKENAENLDNFYKRYTKRDNKFIKTPKLPNYKLDLPEQFNKIYPVNNESQEFIESIEKAAQLLYKKQIDDIPPIINEMQLENYNKEDLAKTAQEIIKRMKPLNEIEGNDENEHEYEPQYSSITKFIELKTIEKNLEKINSKEENDDDSDYK